MDNQQSGRLYHCHPCRVFRFFRALLTVTASNNGDKYFESVIIFYFLAFATAERFRRVQRTTLIPEGVFFVKNLRRGGRVASFFCFCERFIHGVAVQDRQTVYKVCPILHFILCLETQTQINEWQAICSNDR